MRPAGSDPDPMENVYGPPPPVAPTPALYGNPTVPLGSCVVEMLNPLVLTKPKMAGAAAPATVAVAL